MCEVISVRVLLLFVNSVHDNFNQHKKNNNIGLFNYNFMWIRSIIRSNIIMKMTFCNSDLTKIIY